MPRIDFNALPPEALLRSGDFLRPSGPVPVGRTVWSEMVADGRASTVLNPETVLKIGANQDRASLAAME